MNRKQFILSVGGYVGNPRDWSFVNEADRVVIFGAWDIHTEGNTTQILSEDWAVSRNGNKQGAYTRARRHIRLIEEEGYALMTFKQKYSDENEGDGSGPAAIGDFDRELKSKKLKRVGKSWYAADGSLGNALPEEVTSPERFFEGASQEITVNAYERNRGARAQCLAHFGYRCAVCSFDFFDTYGDIGKEFIHVHHIIPLADIGQEYEVNPITDLIPVCPNCHAMIHRVSPALTIDDLKTQLQLVDG